MACGIAMPGAPTATPTPTPSPAPTTTPAPGDPFAHARELCFQETNRYRASVGAAPLAVQPSAVACTDGAVSRDAQSGHPHGSYGLCHERAQNECPSWPGPPENMVAPCLKMMFDEGPGDYANHGHYINMTNAAYSKMACGFAVGPDGKIWLLQNFF